MQSTILKNEWKYYQIDSISNFIFHIDDLSSSRLRESVAEKIENFLEKVKIKANETQNLIFENENDYRNHLKSITSDLAQMHFELSQIYNMELGFIIKPFYPLLVVSMLVLFFIINYFYSTAFALVVVLGYTLFRVVYTQIKIKARKVY